MTFSYSLMQTLQQAAAGLSRVSDGAPELHISPPAKEDEVNQYQLRLGHVIPSDIRDFFTTCAASVRFAWFADSSKLDVPVTVRGIDMGECDISLESLDSNWTNWTGWEDCFEHPDDYCGSTPLVGFDSLFPIAHTSNGDALVLVTEGPHRGEVYYLNHEGGDMDWVRLAPTFQNFLDTWFRLGCPGPEAECLRSFYDDETNQLSCKLPESTVWICELGLDGRRPRDADVDLAPTSHRPQPCKDEHLFVFHQGSRSGYINSAGESVLEFRNASLGDFHEGLASFGVRDHYGYINRTGELVVEPQFDGVGDFSDGRGLVRTFERINGFVDRRGQVVIPIVYKEVGHFHFERAWVDINGKFGFLDVDGDLAIEAVYDGATDFNDGLAKIYLDNLQGYINVQGDVVIPPQFKQASGFFEGFAIVVLNHKQGYIDKSGSIAIEPRYDDANVFSEGLAGVNLGGSPVEMFKGFFTVEGGKWGFINSTGELIIPPRFDSVGEFSEGLAPIKMAERWGYIDREGSIVIEPRFCRAEPFVAGLAHVTDDADRYGYVDRSGNSVWHE